MHICTYHSHCLSRKKLSKYPSQLYGLGDIRTWTWIWICNVRMDVTCDSLLKLEATCLFRRNHSFCQCFFRSILTARWIAWLHWDGNKLTTHWLLFKERAKYRWLARRAQLASQWVWLQAQVSDLEYKIRQHTDLYRSQRASKGSVQLGEETVSWPAHAKVAQVQGSGDHGVPLSFPVPSRVYGLSRYNINNLIL